MGELESEEEIRNFEKDVATWIEGIMSLRVLFKIMVKSSPGYLSRQRIVKKIEERIDYLLEHGPDNKSTLSGMVFATDDDETNAAGSASSSSMSKRLTREEIIDNALILIFAGSETSASTLTNAMLFLGLHKPIWDKLVEEQRQIMSRQLDQQGSTTSSVDDAGMTNQMILDAANNAPYLDAFLKETMRMRVVVGGIPRKTLTDITVDIGEEGSGEKSEVTIPQGWLIDPSLILTHEEDPATKLPDAEHLDAVKGFRPERWLSSPSGGSDQKPSTDWYVPYGYGPRYCLGKNLAQLEMKIFLSEILRTVDHPKLQMLANSDNDEDFSVKWGTKMAVISTPADGVLASVEHRPLSIESSSGVAAAQVPISAQVSIAASNSTSDALIP